ncbi:MAG: hypothetical protein GX777_00690 [Fastidiosipila sp.]|nr:hypothetical protein [Fastidiosipila sp.]
MARYCFYCGRELKDNEKCYCRARTRAESAAKSAVSGTGQNTDEKGPGTAGSTAAAAGTQDSTGTAGSSGRTSSNVSSETTTGSSDTKSSWQAVREKRKAAREKRKAERERLRAVKAEAKRRSKAEKERRRQAYQPGSATGRNPYGQKSSSHRTQQARSFGRELLQLLTRPADAIKAQAVPFWSLSHTIFFISSALLGGAHITLTNRWIYSILFSDRLTAPNLQGAGLYFSGVLASAVFLLLYAGVIWLLARFLFRQGGLPFTHSLAVGKTAWAYLTFFMLIALPTTIQGGFFGLLLVLMGLAFSCLIHARSVAVITHLTENQTISLTLVSILIYTSIFSAVIVFFQTMLSA